MLTLVEFNMQTDILKNLTGEPKNASKAHIFGICDMELQ